MIMLRPFQLTIFLFSFLYSLSVFAFNDTVTHLPGLKSIDHKQYAGYAKITAHKKLFYWFVASDKKNAPIILWSNGGPGYSSLYGFFNETGPYTITNTLQLNNNKNGWNHFANYLVIDQPVHVGLSNIKKNSFDHSTAQVTDDYYLTLQWFFAHHPAYQNRPIYLAGESYAGTYLPLLAKKIMTENKTNPRKINLSGLILVSPWSAPATQQSMDTTYALTHGFITPAEKKRIDLIYAHCKDLIKAKQFGHANTICGKIGDDIQSFSKIPNLANTAYTKNDDNKILDQYINQPALLRSIHATEGQPFHCFSNPVSHYLEGDIQKSVRNIVGELLTQHIPIVIFSGLNDMKDTNFLGVEKFIHKIKWSGKKTFLAAPKKPVIISTKSQNTVIGYQQAGGELTWVTVINAGHMVPQDQPRIDRMVRSTVTTTSIH